MGSLLSSEPSLQDDFTRRIVVLGKTGAGKSSLANTLFGENVCKAFDSATSGTGQCQAESRAVRGKTITFIDTPGFFDTGRPEDEMKSEILKCIVECSPGPHVFILVLKVEKYTEQEQDIVNKMVDYFSDRVLRFTTVLFTHGDQLADGQTIEEFVRESTALSALVKKCGDRCNVIDNKYWKDDKHKYRSNKCQVEKLLTTIDNIIKENGGSYYSNENLQNVTKRLEQEEEDMKRRSPNMPQHEISKKSRAVAKEKLLKCLSELSTGHLLRMFLHEEPVLVLGIELTRALAAAKAGGEEE